MKIFISHASDFDYKKELYIPIQQSELDQKYDFIYLFDETDSPGSTHDRVKNSDLVLAEVSYKSMGLGVELGWATAYGIPVFAIHKEGLKGSSYIGEFTDYLASYTSTSEMLDKIAEGIKQVTE